MKNGLGRQVNVEAAMILVTLDGDLNLGVCPLDPVASHQVWVMAQQVTATLALQLVLGQLDDVNILERNNWELGVWDEVAEDVENAGNDGEEHG